MAAPRLEMTDEEYATFKGRVSSKKGRTVGAVLAELARKWMECEEIQAAVPETTGRLKTDVDFLAELQRLGSAVERIEAALTAVISGAGIPVSQTPNVDDAGRIAARARQRAARYLGDKNRPKSA